MSATTLQRSAIEWLIALGLVIVAVAIGPVIQAIVRAVSA